MVELTDDTRREIGQHFVVGFHGYDVSPDIELLIRDYHVGNIILMKRNVKSAKQVHALVQKLQQIAKSAGHERPLMIGMDQENGLVSAFSVAHSNDAGTQFPGAMALAAAGSPDVAERITEASALELKLAGINWAYSPVGDVNSDPAKPCVRSFGDVPEEVSKYVTAVCRGLTKAGIAPSVKHFPGHGDTHIDSHIALPIISKDAASLAQNDLVPFRAASDAGVATIMVGHMALPAITGDTVPASLSHAVIGGLLRDSLGYGGVVVTDCLEMAARGPSLGHAGLRASGQRIAALKDAFAGGWEQVLGREFDEAGWARLKAAHVALSRQTYAASIALVRNPGAVVPLPKSGATVVLTPRMESLNRAVDDDDDDRQRPARKNTAGSSYMALAESVRKRVDGASVHVVYAPDEPLGGAELQDAASVLFVTRNADRSTWQLDRLRAVLRLGKRVVVLASYAPYDLLAAPPDIEGLCDVGYVASFEFTAGALDAAAAVIFGEEVAKGKVPVCGANVLPDWFP
ncbi:glycoside hydrolase family 3 protein [Lactarius akahatsu]|uniref:Glycoside hydrolase family 3 protein n=1 Tax=Lactarius akahatsu TaxID=416441 RepID=A0AAD4L833_9AGAM|nr:glycoside hydrolase family 3 protein [Lactarius akahatsu]